jgi:branched-subunit amino acid transport protein AzlD
MTQTTYILAVMVIGFAITFALRAVPFVALRPLRESRLVSDLALWMPVGILAILTVSTLRSSLEADASRLLPAALATAVTVLVHLVGGRRTLLSVGAGTAVFVVLVNLV